MSVYWLSLATRTPPQFYSQEELFRMAGYGDFPSDERRRVQVLFKGAGIEKRAMWLEPGDARPKTDPDDFHHRYLSGIREIAPQVAQQALDQAGLKGSDIDFLVFTSCTGYTCPGFSAEIATLLNVPRDRPTANLLGMGCSALVPSLERAWDHLVARPGTRALVISAEICSATYWIDHDLETAMGNALFGDGAAAIVLTSKKEDIERKARSKEFFAHIEGFKTLREGKYLSDMGFTQKEGRLRVRLAREVPERIIPLVLEMVTRLEVPAGSRLAFHPGGKRILDVLEKALLPQSEQWKEPVQWSRDVLRSNGNMSSPTAAFVLERSLVNRPVYSGEMGGLVTMGPGLSVEGMRMRWMNDCDSA
jgi:predicted naringenin-chalcone synthase